MSELIANAVEANEEEAIEQGLRLVSEAFSPAAPVSHRDLFAGRQRQLFRVVDVIAQLGQHAVIYGERGVGKTSLAKVASFDAEFPAIHYTCHSGDTFGTLWSEVFSDLTVTARSRGIGFASPEVQRTTSITDLVGLTPDSATPATIRRGLRLLESARPVIVIDEFDQVEDAESHTLMADTVKILSDQGVTVTVILVGVGATVEDLLAEHQSIERCLTQVRMPKMQLNELREVVSKGMEKCQISVTDSFVDRVARMCNGLPHYAHLIGQHAARSAVEEHRNKVGPDHLRSAIDLATEDVSRSVVNTFTNATWEGAKSTHYLWVLAACALAEKDELGRFGTPQVRDALGLLGHPLAIPNFTPHLNDFSGDGARGAVLAKEGKPGGRQLYEFRNPLLPPYILMKAYSRGVLTDEVAERI